MRWFHAKWFAPRWFAARWLAAGAEQQFRVVRIGNVTEVTLLDPPATAVAFHWYLDGAWGGKTAGPTKSFYLSDGEQARIDCIATADADFDPVANAPESFAGRRTLWWVRSLAADVARYRVEEQVDGGAWTQRTELPADDRWSYSWLTDRLTDLAEYLWRVTPIDLAGNEGTPITIGQETIVRRPDAPNFTVTLNEAQTVTIAVASG